MLYQPAQFRPIEQIHIESRGEDDHIKPMHTLRRAHGHALRIGCHIEPGLAQAQRELLMSITAQDRFKGWRHLLFEHMPIEVQAALGGQSRIPTKEPCKRGPLGFVDLRQDGTTCEHRDCCSARFKGQTGIVKRRGTDAEDADPCTRQRCEGHLIA
jgi:hypothetical protein